MDRSPAIPDSACALCAEALVAGTVALMTTWADPCSHAALDADAQRALIARKVVSNLYFLRQHPALSAELRQVMAMAHERWVALARCACAATNRDAAAALHLMSLRRRRRVIEAIEWIAFVAVVVLLWIAIPVQAQDAAPPPAGAASTPAQQLQPVTVTGIRQKATATKQDVELRGLPQSVSTVSAQTVEERAYTRVEDIGYATVNLQANAPYTGGATLGFFSRGFNGTLALIDGYTTGYAFPVFEVVSYDKYEVLRGPASVLYGQGNPGGVLNMTLKRAGPVFGLALEGQADSVGTRRGSIDWNQPLGETLALRTIALVEQSDTFRDFGRAERRYVSPGLRWTPTPDTTIDALVSHGRFSYNNDRGFGANPTLIAELPVARNLSEPWLPLNRFVVTTARLEASHKLDQQWTLGAGAFYLRSIQRAAAEIGFENTVQGTTVSRYYIDYPDDDKNKSAARTLTATLRGRFDALGVQHHLIAGVERTNFYYLYEALAGAVDPIDYLNPVYGSGPAAPADQFNYAGGGGNRIAAIYVNDLITLAPRWKLQLGLRHDRITAEGYSDAAFTVSDVASYRKTTPSIGVVWQPDDTLALYANHTTSFLPQFGRNRFGEILRPEEGRAFEIGLKQGLLDERLALTAAVFEIRKTNILQGDSVDPAFNINGGEAKSRGFEIELSGRPKPGTEVAAGIGYADAKWTKSNDFAVGSRLAGASPVTALLSGKQNLGVWLQRSSWVSAALSYGSAREWSPSTTPPRLEAYTRLDLGAGVSIGDAELQFNLKNATNERLYLANGYGLVAPDTPRAFGVTLRFRTGVS